MVKPTREEAEERLHELAAVVANEIGWRVGGKSYGHYVEISGEGEERLGLRVEDVETLKISGVFPTHEDGREVWSLPYGKKTPSIKVSLWRKTPDQIGRDIERRLWPEYAPLLAEAIKSREERRSHETTSKDVAERLASVVGAKVKRLDGGNLEIDMYRSRELPEFTGDVKVSGDSVRFDRFYVSPSEAEAMLVALVETRKGR